MRLEIWQRPPREQGGGPAEERKVFEDVPHIAIQVGWTLAWDDFDWDGVVKSVLYQVDKDLMTVELEE